MQHSGDINQLFESVGFSNEYLNDTVTFYNEYFDNDSEMNVFFEEVFADESRLNYSPRRMMNRVRYLVSLAQDIDSIRHESDALKVVFFQSCIEGLHKLSKSKALHNHFFLDNSTETDGEYIKNHFEIFNIAPLKNDGELDGEVSEIYNSDMTLVLFAEVLKETRNIVLHEGDFWSVQLFNAREDCGLLSSIQSSKKYIKDEIKNSYLQYCDEETRTYFERHDTLIKLLNSSGDLLYSFNTTLDFQKFTAIFVRTCINFIRNFINTN